MRLQEIQAAVAHLRPTGFRVRRANIWTRTNGTAFSDWGAACLVASSDLGDVAGWRTNCSLREPTPLKTSAMSASFPIYLAKVLLECRQEGLSSSTPLLFSGKVPSFGERG